MKLEEVLNVLMSTTYCTIKIAGMDRLSFVEYSGYNQKAFYNVIASYMKSVVTDVKATSRDEITIYVKE
jgi:hypothetical protein